MTKIAVLSGIGDEAPWVPQFVPDCTVVTFRFTDLNFPPRVNAMTPRLQARIPKALGWMIVPGYDIYVWIDASFALEREDAVAWLVAPLSYNDWVCFPHPARASARAEAQFLRQRASDRYIRQRYTGERLEEQMHWLEEEGFGEEYADDRLFAAGVFAYVPSAQMKEMLKEWWFYESVFHLDDQLTLPFLLWKHELRVYPLASSIFANSYFVHTQNRKWKAEHAHTA